MSNQYGAPPAGAQSGNRNLIIIIIVVLLLCCCCALLAGIGWFYGDQILALIQPTPATPLLLKLMA